AMGMEIVWFRHLGALLGSYRWVLSLILTVILLGIWLGAMAGGALHRRAGHPVALYVIAQALFVLAALWGLATAETRGANAERAVGRRAGLLYLANTVGAVLGSLVVGFVLLSALGMQRTVTVLGVAVAVGVVPLCIAAPHKARRQRIALGAVVVALGFGVV